MKNKYKCFECKDCGINILFKGEYYMIHNDLWGTLKVKGMLCIGCLEKRLKRKLVSSDFPNLPINKLDLFKGGKSVRLLRRQSYPLA